MGFMWICGVFLVMGNAGFISSTAALACGLDNSAEAS